MTIYKHERICFIPLIQFDILSVKPGAILQECAWFTPTNKKNVLDIRKCFICTRSKNKFNMNKQGRKISESVLFRPGVTKFGPGGPVSLQILAPTLIKHTWSS